MMGGRITHGRRSFALPRTVTVWSRKQISLEILVLGAYIRHGSSTYGNFQKSNALIWIPNGGALITHKTDSKEYRHIWNWEIQNSRWLSLVLSHLVAGKVTDPKYSRSQAEPHDSEVYSSPNP